MGRSNYSLTYAVDMTFVIDATGSMKDLLDTVKDNALNFYNDVCVCMERKHKKVNQLRVRVVAFRDYVADGNEAMLVTDFFNLPEQNDEFEKCVRSIEHKGGGDEPEDGLEALAYAIKSKWFHEESEQAGLVKKRHVIVVWTDASTHELGYGSGEPNYPKNMAKDMGELTAWWGDEQNPGFMDQYAKRLVLFTPDEPGWSFISKNWDKTIFYPSIAGEGLAEVDYGTILDTVAGTI